MSSVDAHRVGLSILNLIREVMGKPAKESFLADTKRQGSGSITFSFDFLYRQDKSVFAEVYVSYYENGFPTPNEKITASIQFTSASPNQVIWNNNGLFYIKIPVYKSDGEIEPCLLKPDENTAPENLSLLIHATVKHFLYLIRILETLNNWNHSVVETWTKSFIKKGYEVSPPPEYKLTVTSSRSLYDPRTFEITAIPLSEDVSVDRETMNLSALESFLSRKLQARFPTFHSFNQQYIDIDKRLDVLLLHCKLYGQ